MGVRILQIVLLLLLAALASSRAAQGLSTLNFTFWIGAIYLISETVKKVHVKCGKVRYFKICIFLFTSTDVK